jgi:hypothetical protein
MSPGAANEAIHDLNLTTGDKLTARIASDGLVAK